MSARAIRPVVLAWALAMAAHPIGADTRPAATTAAETDLEAAGLLRGAAGAKNLPAFALLPLPTPRPAAPLTVPRPDAGPNKAAHAAAAALPPRPRWRAPASCTADRAFCIAPVAYTRDVCRTIAGVAEEAGIDPHYFARLVWQESLFDPYAVSPAGALGIAQFMPGTARLRGLADPFNPARALRASAHYLADLMERFGNPGLAAVAYNGGEARAARFVEGRGGLPAETRDYVRAITGLRAERWRDDPPVRHARALTPGTTFLAACLEKAAGRGLPGPAAAPRWRMIYAADPDRATALGRAEAMIARFPDLLDAAAAEMGPIMLPGRRTPYFSAAIPHAAEGDARAQCDRLRRAGGGCMVLRD